MILREHSLHPPAAGKRTDALLAGIVMVVMFAAVLVGFHRVAPQVLHYSTWDFWFEGDPPAVASQMTDRFSRNHLRTSHHPLTSLLLFPAERGIQSVLNASAEQAIGLVLATIAALWAGIFFATLRLLRLRPFDAMLFTMLAAVSASVVFWFPVPEAYATGAVGIVLAITALALSERGLPLPFWTRTAVAAGTLAGTSTNWMAGLLMLVRSMPWRRALAAASASAVLVLLLWGLQKLIFPTAGAPWHLTTAAETGYLFNPESLGLLRKGAAFLFHSIVAPELGSAYGFRLSVQGVFPGAGGLLSAAGAISWALLLVIAAISVKRWGDPRVPLVLVLLLLGQLVVALVFGVETFLYSAHWGPVLVMLCALATLTPARTIVVTVAACLTVLAGVNNLRAFAGAADAVAERYDHERRFTERVAALTSVESPVICGRHAAAAQGEPALAAGRAPSNAPLEDIASDDDPDTCYFRFDGPLIERKGWIVSYENWSIETVEALRARGARYFITPYRYGIEHNPALFAELDRRFRKLEHTPDWVFYDLSPTAPTSSPPPVTREPAGTPDPRTQRT
jgi:hypothetical protein